MGQRQCLHLVHVVSDRHDCVGMFECNRSIEYTLPRKELTAFAFLPFPSHTHLDGHISAISPLWLHSSAGCWNLSVRACAHGPEMRRLLQALLFVLPCRPGLPVRPVRQHRTRLQHCSSLTSSYRLFQRRECAPQLRQCCFLPQQLCRRRISVHAVMICEI